MSKRVSKEVKPITRAIQACQENHRLDPNCRGDIRHCEHGKAIHALKVFDFENLMFQMRQREILAAKLINRRNQLIDDTSPEKSEFVLALDEVFNLAINYVKVEA